MRKKLKSFLKFAIKRVLKSKLNKYLLQGNVNAGLIAVNLIKKGIRKYKRFKSRRMR